MVNAQRDLLRGISESLDTIRVFLQSHPKVQESEWLPPAQLEGDWFRL